MAEDGALETRACDYRSNWMTAVEALDADTYLGAENSYNLFALRKNSDAAADEDRSRLEARRRLRAPGQAGRRALGVGRACLCSKAVKLSAVRSGRLRQLLPCPDSPRAAFAYPTH